METMNVSNKKNVLFKVNQPGVSDKQFYIGVNVDVDRFTENPMNPNEMNAKQFDLLTDNIKRNGYLDPILCRPFGDKFQIINGHHRLKALKSMGKTVVPTCFIANFTEDEAVLEMIMQNRLSGSFNESKLNVVLTKLKDEFGEDKLSEMTGWADAQLRDLTKNYSANKTTVIPPLSQEAIQDLTKKVNESLSGGKSVFGENNTEKIERMSNYEPVMDKGDDIQTDRKVVFTLALKKAQFDFVTKRLSEVHQDKGVALMKLVRGQA